MMDKLLEKYTRPVSKISKNSIKLAYTIPYLEIEKLNLVVSKKIEHNKKEDVATIIEIVNSNIVVKSKKM